MKNNYLIFSLFLVFIIISFSITNTFKSEKRLKTTIENYNYLINKIELYKSVYGHYPETLNNLITDTHVINGVETFFIAAVPAEFLTGTYSNKVQVGGELKQKGNGWWYDNKKGKIKINNFNINVDFFEKIL